MTQHVFQDVNFFSAKNKLRKINIAVLPYVLLVICHMTKDHKYTMWFDKAEKERISEWGKTQGYSSLAKLIEDSLDAIQRNPHLLHPTENQDATQILESLKDLQSGGMTDEISQLLQKLSDKVDRLEQGQEWIMSKLGATKKDKHRIYKQDPSNEAVFE